MFDVDFKLKNETDFTIKVFTMIEGEYAPAVMILKPNEEMLHFKPSIGEISISVMAKRSSEIERLREALESFSCECETEDDCCAVVGSFCGWEARAALKEGE